MVLWFAVSVLGKSCGLQKLVGFAVPFMRIITLGTILIEWLGLIFFFLYEDGEVPDHWSPQALHKFYVTNLPLDGGTKYENVVLPPQKSYIGSEKIVRGLNWFKKFMKDENWF